MRPFIEKSNPLFVPAVLSLALALMFCEPGKSLDPILPNNNSGDSGVPVAISVLSAPTQVLPTDTAMVQVSIMDSATGLPLAKGAKLSVTSLKFAVLAANAPGAFKADSVPADGKISFRIASASPGLGTIAVKVTSGLTVRSLSIAVLVTEKPVPPKIKVELLPTTIKPKDSSLVKFQILDSVMDKPLLGAEVGITSSFFTVVAPDSRDALSLDTTGNDGRVSFRIVSAATGPGSFQVKVRTAAGILRSATYTVAVLDTTGPGRPRKMVFSAARSTLRADGTDSTDLNVLVKDDNNNPLPGEVIRFVSSGGLVKPQAITDVWGRAVGMLVSERVNKKVVVTATLEKTGATAQQTVAFDGVTIAINPAKRILMKNTVNTLIYELRDGGNVPISGDSLEITVNGATKGFEGKGKDSLLIVTDTKGQYSTYISSDRDAVVILSARGLGAVTFDTVIFTANTLSLAAGKSSLSGDGVDKTTLTATLQKEGGAAMPGMELRWTTTFGDFTTTPFTETNSSGKSTIELRSPRGSGLAIINVEAYEKASNGTRTMKASGNMVIPIKALKVSRLELKVTPDNIPVKTGETRLVAQAFDSANNVMTGVLVGFRLVKGAGGGDEVITPPVNYTKAGAAEAVLRAGGVISLYRGVKLAAVALDISGNDTLVVASSDTVGLTISGPPHKVSVGVNIQKGENIDDGTFALPTAAVVTDVNGNLVADGTPVNFSVTPIGAMYYGISYHIIDEWPYYLLGDTAMYRLPWTDYNNNRKLDSDEELSSWDLTRSRPFRGEDRDGNGIINVPPEDFVDVNENGIWDSAGAEPNVSIPRTDTINTHSFVDYNKDGIQQDAEFFWDYNGDGKCQCAGGRDSQGNLYEGTFFGSSPIRPFPGDVAVGINRVTETGGGKATTRIVYVQSQARKVRVRITAESNGFRSFVDTDLPIVQSDGGN